MMRFKNFFPLFILLLSLLACQDKSRQQAMQKTPKSSEPLIKVNKSLIKADAEKIERYIKRHNLEMANTGTGLRYAISGEGSGEKARFGQYARIDYKVSLLDGTLCYTSEKGPEEFLVGMDDVESGLHEGITYMKVGQKAKFILPPHLAHGLIGDEGKIPARAIIVYDIELLNLR